MTIGVYPYDLKRPSTICLQFDFLFEPDVMQKEVDIVPLASLDDLRRVKVNAVHILGTGREQFNFAKEIRNRDIPFAVSPMVASRHSTWVIRAMIAGASLTKGFSGKWASDLSTGATMCSVADYVLSANDRQHRIIEEGFGIAKEKIITIRDGVDDRFVLAKSGLFTEKFGVDRFILADAMEWQAETNILCLIQALEKINHPAVILGSDIHSEYEQQCRAVAKNNPHVRIINTIPNRSDLYFSAFSSSEVYVDVSPHPFCGLALNAAAAGTKIVVSKSGGMDEYFADEAEYVEPTSWELIHHGITTALNKQPSESLRQRIKDRHLSMQNLAMFYKKIYQSMLKR